jgi:hypothetical protein
MAINGTRPAFNKGLVSIRQQDTTLARAAAITSDIQFSVSVRGVHWMVTEDVISHEFGAHKGCKVPLNFTCV